MPTYAQATQTMAVATPLGKDALILVGFTGQEAISQLFNFQLDLLAENKTDVPFDKLLGQGVAVGLSLPSGNFRYFQGICSRLLQGGRDEIFTSYRMEMVPAAWLLTRRVQSRIFQHLSVPDILKKVFADLDVAYEIMGTFYPRDYCVQYQESDFAFASRLMEEEGIYYFFKHTDDGCKMVLGNTPQSHPDMPEQSKVIFEEVSGGAREEMRVYEWQKVQELRSGKVTLWDHCFELPHKHLEAQQLVLDSVAAGKVVHKLKVGNNDKLEIFNYPGAYAQRFDGVDKGGSPQEAELQKIFKDNQRTAAIRMQQEAAAALQIEGAGNCGQFVSGFKFTLERHFNADGPYLLTGVRHTAKQAGDLRSGKGADFSYNNSFTCIPFALPFRPQRVTPRPVVHGTQTAVVVGPAGKEEIFCDKYGRVKVQFHWDRQGQYDVDSSCWVRVATAWAGKGWGQINIPRIGHEVIVDFLEGDPDNPIIVGSVYNAENMPAKKLPEGRKTCGLVTRSNESHGGGYNQVTCEDTKDKEQIIIHGQYDLNATIEHDDNWTVHNDRTYQVDGKFTETILQDTTIKVTWGKYNHDVFNNTADYHVQGKLTEKYDNDQETTVALNVFLRSTGGTIREEALAGEFYVYGKNKVEVKSGGDEVHVLAAKKIKLVTGDSMLVMQSDGTIILSGTKITISGGDTAKIGVGNQNVICDQQKVAVSGAAINSSAVGMHEITGALVKIN